ncbi:MAG TPA: EAL domain-containing protein, partial [Bordetella sp.]|nr:EAL domain-containing protein [Bordetella sp.]
EKTGDFIMHVEKQQLSWLDAGEDPMKPSTGGRARESGHIERCFNFATDARVAHWLPSLEKSGYRSAISLPLGSPHGEHSAIVLSVYSGMPGGFSSSEQHVFFTQIKDLLVFGINKLEAFKETPDTIPYSTRTRWRSLLRGSGLEMHYQPVMELPSGKVTKVEALARLRDGADILTPGAFLPALTSEDLFVLYVKGLDKIMAQRKTWASQGITLDLAINLPASALGNARYIEATQKALDEHGCPPSAITLEILETEEVSADVDLLEALKSYKKLGVQLAEDDLGSGYSTLARLRGMPVDIIKIDQSIVGNAAEDPYNTLRFIYQLTRLGHGLGKKVVVEGVEDMALLHALIRLGADCAQGYAIARPMPAAQLEHWLSQPHELSIPEHEQLTHTLPRLADALVWEEDLHVIREESPFGGIRETVLGNIYAAMGDARVLDPREQAAKADLIECSIKFGQRSNEYMAARNRLIELLVHGSWSTPHQASAGAQPSSDISPFLRQ